VLASRRERQRDADPSRLSLLAPHFSGYGEPRPAWSGAGNFVYLEITLIEVPL
jgi:hypothetical protein